MKRIDLANSLGVQKYFLSIGVLLSVFFLLTITVGIYFVYLDLTTVGTVVFIIATSNVTIQGLWEIIHTYSNIMKDLVSAKRMKELVDKEIDIKNTDNSIIPQDSHQKLRLLNVKFKYPSKEKNVLDGINLDINPSEMVALVEKSGSGKTTIIKILNRMYEVTKGNILLGNHGIKNINLAWYRRQFAIVQQDVDVFDGTLDENIAYTHGKINEHNINQAIKAAHLDEVLSNKHRFPKGIHTQVGERSVRLSGGERQRVGIARAYLNLISGAKFLILDEATSSLDSEAERAIQEMIEELRQKLNISIIAIAHRLSTIQRADKICVIENGQIAEQGSHNRLMMKNSLYSKLVKLQKIGEIRK